MADGENRPNLGAKIAPETSRKRYNNSSLNRAKKLYKMAKKKDPKDSENPEPNPDQNPDLHNDLEPEQESLTQQVTSAYTAENIQVLEGLEAVRQRPAMYIGDTGTRGLHHLFNEVLDNSIDEALAGHCDKIICTLHTDDSVSVKDNGRGIPVEIHEQQGVSALQVVMCTLHAGGKFGGGGYHVSGGLHGVGVSCVNALSAKCVVNVERDGKEYTQEYLRGKPVAPVKEIGKAKGRGTTTRWWADEEIFGQPKYDANIFKARIRELAYLNPQVAIEFINESNPEQNQLFHYRDGIKELVEELNVSAHAIHKPIYFKKVRDEVEVECALQYTADSKETILSYANNINTIEGGTHTSGAKTALTRAINQHGRKTGLIKEKEANFTGEDVRAGLTLVVSVKLYHPQFEGQTKTKLGNGEVEGVVNSIFGESMTQFLEENPAVSKRIIEKASVEQRVREAARKAAEAVRRSNAVDSYGLAAKLADCIEKDPSRTELFIVEGDSAGGSAKQARDRRFQAVLPIKGKILNVQRARVDKALDNEEIKALISSLGTGIDHPMLRDPDSENGASSSFDLTKLRYDKVIILSDADVDGEHIRTLLLTFFYNYMQPLITSGHVYFAKLPLFVVKAGKDERFYANDEKERDEIIKGLKKKDVQVTRFKGLGEMEAEELEETAMNPDKRRLIKIGLGSDDANEAELIFNRLMGEKVEPRRAFIEAHAKEVTDVDWHY